MILNEIDFKAAVQDGSSQHNTHIKDVAYSQLNTYLMHPTLTEVGDLIHIWTYMMHSTQFKALDAKWYQTAIYTWLSRYMRTDNVIWSDAMLDHLTTVPALTPLLYMHWHRMPLPQIESRNKKLSTWASICHAMNMSVREALVVLDQEDAIMDVLTLPEKL